MKTYRDSFWVAAILLVIIASLARACIGETEPQLVQRYGKVQFREAERTTEQQRTYTVGERLLFQTADWRITALLIHGRCEHIQYGKAGDWTEEQFAHLLEINGGRARWTEEHSNMPNLKRRWKRNDGVVADWNPMFGFILTSPVYDQTRAAIKAAAKAEASKQPPF